MFEHIPSAGNVSPPGCLNLGSSSVLGTLVILTMSFTLSWVPLDLIQTLGGGCAVIVRSSKGKADGYVIKQT